MNQPKSNRWEIYLDDLRKKGIVNFITDRLKKRKFTRWLYSRFRKSFVLIRGRKLFVNRMDTVVSDTLLKKGVWEPLITKIFSQYAGKSKIVVDVGANLGYYTLIASFLVRKGGKVIAFEPASSNYDYIRKTVDVNGLQNVILEKKALDRSEGLIHIYLDEENFGDHRTYQYGEITQKREQIDAVTLDRYFSAHKGNIDLLKIDIQGYEYQAFLGAKTLLKSRRIGVIISELWPEGLKMAGDDWKKYIGLLIKSGFRIFQIDEELNKIIPFSSGYISQRTRADKTYTTNLLAILKK